MASNRMGPPCPECGSLLTGVTRTCRSKGGDFARRRLCPCCGLIFQTIQPAELITGRGDVHWQGHRIEIDWPMVVPKLLRSISRRSSTAKANA